MMAIGITLVIVGELPAISVRAAGIGRFVDGQCSDITGLAGSYAFSRVTGSCHGTSPSFL